MQGVLGRLKTARAAERPFWAQPRVLQIAAAVVLIVGGGWLVRTRIGPEVLPVPVLTARAAGELDDLSAAQLTALLPALDSAADTVAPPDDAGIEGLSADDLRQLLAVMKGEG